MSKYHFSGLNCVTTQFCLNKLNTRIIVAKNTKPLQTDKFPSIYFVAQFFCHLLLTDHIYLYYYIIIIYHINKLFKIIRHSQFADSFFYVDTRRY